MPTGYVYALSNPMYPDLLKIGHTTLQVSERATELSRATGVVHPFTIEYWRLTLKARDVELKVHQHLIDRRENKKREFFRVSLDEAISAIEQYTKDPQTVYRNALPATIQPLKKGTTFRGQCSNCSRTFNIEVLEKANAVTCPHCRRRMELTRFLRQRHFGL